MRQHEAAVWVFIVPFAGLAVAWMRGTAVWAGALIGGALALATGTVVVTLMERASHETGAGNAA